MECKISERQIKRDTAIIKNLLGNSPEAAKDVKIIEKMLKECLK